MAIITDSDAELSFAHTHSTNNSGHEVHSQAKRFTSESGTCQVLCWNALKTRTSPGDTNLASAQFTSKPTGTAHSVTDTAISLQTVPASHTELCVHRRSNYTTVRWLQELCVNTS